MKRSLPQDGTHQDTNHDGGSDVDETPRGLPTDSNLPPEYARSFKRHNEERLVRPYPKTRTPTLFTSLNFFVANPKLIHPQPEWYIPYPSRTRMFGKHFDCAVSYCLRKHGTKGVEAALVLLRDYGAPAHEEDATGVTPILLALEKGALAVVDYLLTRHDGVDLALHRAYDGKNSVRVAAENGHVDVLKKILSIIPAAPGHVRSCAMDMVSPIAAACRMGHLAVVQCLVQREPPCYLRGRDHRTPFITAIEHRHTPIVQYLLESGKALVNERLPSEMDYKRQTALNWAFQTGMVDMVKVLVSHGCELAVQYSQTEILLDVATPEMVPVLCPQNQVFLLQQQRRREWVRKLMRTYYLVQQGHALIHFPGFPCTETLWNQNQENMLKSPCATTLSPGLDTLEAIIDDPLSDEESDSNGQVELVSTAWTLLRLMSLPFPLVQMIVNYIPAPPCWDERLKILTTRSLTVIEPPGTKTKTIHSTLELTLDLLDEVFERAGFLQACDEAGIPVWPSLSPFEVIYQNDNNPDGDQSVLDLYANNKDLDLSKVQSLLNGENSDIPQGRSYCKGPVGFKNWTSWMRWCKRHCPKFRRQEADTDVEGNVPTLLFQHSANAVVDAFGRKQQPVPFGSPPPDGWQLPLATMGTRNVDQNGPRDEVRAPQPEGEPMQRDITNIQLPSPFLNPLVFHLSHRSEASRTADCGTGDDSSNDGMPVACHLVKTPPLPTMIEIRRYVNYLAMLERHWDKLVPILTRSPYNVPSPLLDQLLVCVDVVRLARRLGSAGNGSNDEIRNIVPNQGAGMRRLQGYYVRVESLGVTFSSTMVQDMIGLVSRFARWYEDSLDKSAPQVGI